MEGKLSITPEEAAVAGQAALAILASKNSAEDTFSANQSQSKKPKHGFNDPTLPESPSKKGMFQGAERGAKQFQEDSFFSWRSPNQVVTVGGIYDGHGGYNGMLASNAARESCLRFFGSIKFECEKWSVPEWRAALPKLFNAIHQDIRDTLKDQSQDRQVDEKGIVRTLNGDPVHGGCTGTIVVQIRQPDGSSTIITANVGDSTAMLCFLDNRADGNKFNITTTKHSPDNADEFLRVQQLSKEEYPHKLLYVYDKTNVFQKYECPLVFLESGQKDERFEKNPWANGLRPSNVRYELAMYCTSPREVLRDSTCIAITRSLGDLYAHQFGLTHVPSITTFELPPDRKCLVAVASDGIWDCWIYNDFADYCRDALVSSNDDIVSAGQKVLDESIRRAISNFGEKHYDDAALIAWVIAPIATEGDAATEGGAAATEGGAAATD